MISNKLTSKSMLHSPNIASLHVLGLKTESGEHFVSKNFRDKKIIMLLQALNMDDQTNELSTLEIAVQIACFKHNTH